MKALCPHCGQKRYYSKRYGTFYRHACSPFGCRCPGSGRLARDGDVLIRMRHALEMMSRGWR